MTPVELLQEKFRGLRPDGVIKHFLIENKVDLSEQCVGSILTAGRQAGTIAMLTLGVGLGCTVEELTWIAKQLGDKTIWRLFDKSALTPQDQRLLSDYHALSFEQRQILNSLIKEFLP